jgi:hypothetical protein
MYESRETSDAAVEFETATLGSGENLIRGFCKSLFRRIHLGQSRATGEQDEAAAADAPLDTCQAAKRVTKQGSFDWGSFSAFDDGSIEVERAGVRQRFRNFSELKRSLNHRSEDEGVPPPERGGWGRSMGLIARE